MKITKMKILDNAHMLVTFEDNSSQKVPLREFRQHPFLTGDSIDGQKIFNTIRNKMMIREIGINCRTSTFRLIRIFH